MTTTCDRLTAAPTRPILALPGSGFGGTKMAAEDWINFDYWDERFEDDSEPQAFRVPCKWCGTKITMTPQDDGSWKPMIGSKVHACEKRIDKSLTAAAASMARISDVDCQFCGTGMEYQKRCPDPEDGWSMSYRFRLTCPNCQSCGPEVNLGDPDYNRLMKAFP